MSENEEYKGVGQFIGTVGGMSLGGFLAGIPAAILGLKGASDLANTNSKKGFGSIGAAVIIKLGGIVAGGIFGYKKAGDAINQYSNLRVQNEKLESQAKILEAEKTVLEEKSKWAEKTGKNPDELFSEREEGKEKDTIER